MVHKQQMLSQRKLLQQQQFFERQRLRESNRNRMNNPGLMGGNYPSDMTDRSMLSSLQFQQQQQRQTSQSPDVANPSESTSRLSTKKSSPSTLGRNSSNFREKEGSQIPVKTITLTQALGNKNQQFAHSPEGKIGDKILGIGERKTDFWYPTEVEQREHYSSDFYHDQV